MYYQTVNIINFEVLTCNHVYSCRLPSQTLVQYFTESVKWQNMQTESVGMQIILYIVFKRSETA